MVITVKIRQSDNELGISCYSNMTVFMPENQFMQLINRVADGKGGGRRPHIAEKMDCTDDDGWRNHSNMVTANGGQTEEQNKRKVMAVSADEATTWEYGANRQTENDAFTRDQPMSAYICLGCFGI